MIPTRPNKRTPEAPGTDFALATATEFSVVNAADEPPLTMVSRPCSAPLYSKASAWHVIKNARYPHKHLHNAAAGRGVSVVVNVVSEERIGDAQHGDDLAHGDVLGDRHGQLDELFRTELVHDLGEEFIVDGIVVVPEAVSERERCPLASRQPRIFDLAVHHRIGQFLLDVLLSRPGQKTSVASIVALVEAGDPEAGDLLGA